MKIWITLAFLAVAGSAMAKSEEPKNGVPQTIQSVEKKAPQKPASSCSYTASAGWASVTVNIDCGTCSQSACETIAFWAGERRLEEKLQGPQL
jgi:hypothetical protein